MKSFVQFLRESQSDSADMPNEMTFSFNFKELPEAKDTIKSLEELSSKDGLNCEVDGESVKITLTREQCDNDKVASIQDVLQQYADMVRKDQQNSSRDSFAQLTKKFKQEVDKMNDFIDFVPEEPEDSDDNDDKKEDE